MYLSSELIDLAAVIMGHSNSKGQNYLYLYKSDGTKVQVSEIESNCYIKSKI